MDDNSGAVPRSFVCDCFSISSSGLFLPVESLLRTCREQVQVLDRCDSGHVGDALFLAQETEKTAQKALAQEFRFITASLHFRCGTVQAALKLCNDALLSRTEACEDVRFLHLRARCHEVQREFYLALLDLEEAQRLATRDGHIVVGDSGNGKSPPNGANSSIVTVVTPSAAISSAPDVTPVAVSARTGSVIDSDIATSLARLRNVFNGDIKDVYRPQLEKLSVARFSDRDLAEHWNDDPQYISLGNLVNCVHRFEDAEERNPGIADSHSIDAVNENSADLRPEHSLVVLVDVDWAQVCGLLLDLRCRHPAFLAALLTYQRDHAASFEPLGLAPRRQIFQGAEKLQVQHNYTNSHSGCGAPQPDPFRYLLCGLQRVPILVGFSERLDNVRGALELLLEAVEEKERGGYVDSEPRRGSGEGNGEVVDGAEVAADRGVDADVDAQSAATSISFPNLVLFLRLMLPFLFGHYVVGDTEVIPHEPVLVSPRSETDLDLETVRKIVRCLLDLLDGSVSARDLDDLHVAGYLEAGMERLGSHSRHRGYASSPEKQRDVLRCLQNVRRLLDVPGAMDFIRRQAPELLHLSAAVPLMARGNSSSVSCTTSGRRSRLFCGLDDDDEKAPPDLVHLLAELKGPRKRDDEKICGPFLDALLPRLVSLTREFTSGSNNTCLNGPASADTKFQLLENVGPMLRGTVLRLTRVLYGRVGWNLKDGEKSKGEQKLTGKESKDALMYSQFYSYVCLPEDWIPMTEAQITVGQRYLCLAEDARWHEAVIMARGPAEGEYTVETRRAGLCSWFILPGTKKEIQSSVHVAFIRPLKGEPSGESGGEGAPPPKRQKIDDVAFSIPEEPPPRQQADNEAERPGGLFGGFFSIMESMSSNENKGARHAFMLEASEEGKTFVRLGANVDTDTTIFSPLRPFLQMLFQLATVWLADQNAMASGHKNVGRGDISDSDSDSERMGGANTKTSLGDPSKNGPEFRPDIVSFESTARNWCRLHERLIDAIQAGGSGTGKTVSGEDATTQAFRILNRFVGGSRTDVGIPYRCFGRRRRYVFLEQKAGCLTAAITDVSRLFLDGDMNGRVNLFLVGLYSQVPTDVLVELTRINSPSLTAAIVVKGSTTNRLAEVLDLVASDSGGRYAQALRERNWGRAAEEITVAFHHALMAGECLPDARAQALAEFFFVEGAAGTANNAMTGMINSDYQKGERAALEKLAQLDGLPAALRVAWGGTEARLLGAISSSSVSTSATRSAVQEFVCANYRPKIFRSFLKLIEQLRQTDPAWLDEDGDRASKLVSALLERRILDLFYVWWTGVEARFSDGEADGAMEGLVQLVSKEILAHKSGGSGFGDDVTLLLLVAERFVLWLWRLDDCERKLQNFSGHWYLPDDIFSTPHFGPFDGISDANGWAGSLLSVCVGLARTHLCDAAIAASESSGSGPPLIGLSRVPCELRFETKLQYGSETIKVVSSLGDFDCEEGVDRDTAGGKMRDRWSRCVAQFEAVLSEFLELYECVRGRWKKELVLGCGFWPENVDLEALNRYALSNLRSACDAGMGSVGFDTLVAKDYLVAWREFFEALASNRIFAGSALDNLLGREAAQSDPDGPAKDASVGVLSGDADALDIVQQFPAYVAVFKDTLTVVLEADGVQFQLREVEVRAEKGEPVQSLRMMPFAGSLLWTSVEGLQLLSQMLRAPREADRADLELEFFAITAMTAPSLGAMAAERQFLIRCARFPVPDDLFAAFTAEPTREAKWEFLRLACKYQVRHHERLLARVCDILSKDLSGSVKKTWGNRKEGTLRRLIKVLMLSCAARNAQAQDRRLAQMSRLYLDCGGSVVGGNVSVFDWWRKIVAPLLAESMYAVVGRVVESTFPRCHLGSDSHIMLEQLLFLWENGFVEQKDDPSRFNNAVIRTVTTDSSAAVVDSEAQIEGHSNKDTVAGLRVADLSRLGTCGFGGPRVPFRRGVPSVSCPSDIGRSSLGLSHEFLRASGISGFEVKMFYYRVADVSDMIQRFDGKAKVELFELMRGLRLRLGGPDFESCWLSTLAADELGRRLLQSGLSPFRDLAVAHVWGFIEAQAGAVCGGCLDSPCYEQVMQQMHEVLDPFLTDKEVVWEKWDTKQWLVDRNKLRIEFHKKFRGHQSRSISDAVLDAEADPESSEVQLGVLARAFFRLTEDDARWYAFVTECQADGGAWVRSPASALRLIRNAKHLGEEGEGQSSERPWHLDPDLLYDDEDDVDHDSEAVAEQQGEVLRAAAAPHCQAWLRADGLEAELARWARSDFVTMRSSPKAFVGAVVVYMLWRFPGLRRDVKVLKEALQKGLRTESGG